MQSSVGVSKRVPVSRSHQHNEELVPMHDIPLPPFRALNALTRRGSRFCGCACNHPASAPTLVWDVCIVKQTSLITRIYDLRGWDSCPFSPLALCIRAKNQGMVTGLEATQLVARTTNLCEAVAKFRSYLEHDDLRVQGF